MKKIKIKDTIHHGSYYNERIVEIEPTLEGFLGLLNSGPYGGGKVATANNKYAVEAWERFASTGKSGFGWRDFVMAE